MSGIVDIRAADAPRDVIHDAVRLLAEGEVVVFPTEGFYVPAVSALRPDAVEKLVALQNETLQHGNDQAVLVLAIKSHHELRDYAPDLTNISRTLARKCWPGPVVLMPRIPKDRGLSIDFDDDVRIRLKQNGRIGFRVTDHVVLAETLRLSPAPLVVADDRVDASGPATAQEAAKLYGEAASLVIDDGPPHDHGPTTTVCVDEESWKIERIGLIDERALRRSVATKYLFVCTGNTCRSPMAEGIFRKLLAERLKCGVEEIADYGHEAASSGLSAAYGMPPSPESVEAVREFGIELDGQVSRPVTDALLDQSDWIFAMTRGHRESILAYRPDLAETVQLLSRDGGDVSDPIGGTMADYLHCRDEITKHLREILEEMEIEAP